MLAKDLKPGDVFKHVRPESGSILASAPHLNKFRVIMAYNDEPHEDYHPWHPDFDIMVEYVNGGTWEGAGPARERTIRPGQQAYIESTDEVELLEE